MHQHTRPATSSVDPRDLTGPFHHEVDIQVRFADTDAMGHVNNAKYLTYCEIARIGYWTDVTGDPMMLGTDRAESLILAEARITYRAPVFHDDRLTVQTPGDPDRAHVSSRSNIGSTACAARRGAPAGRGQRIGAGPLRLRDRARRRPISAEHVAAIEAFEGRSLRATLTARERQASTRRKIATAFWPPKPKPLTATVSTLALRAVERHVVEVALRVGRVEVGGRRDDAVADRAERRPARWRCRPRRRGGRSSTSGELIGDLVGVVAEGRLDRARLGHVVERRRRAVGDDVVDLVGRDPGVPQGRGHRPGLAAAGRLRGADVERVGGQRAADDLGDRASRRAPGRGRATRRRRRRRPRRGRTRRGRGRTAATPSRVESLRFDRAPMLARAATPIGQSGASEPPARTTSHSPRWMSRSASWNAMTDVAQAATWVMTGPVRPYSIDSMRRAHRARQRRDRERRHEPRALLVVDVGRRR